MPLKSLSEAYQVLEIHASATESEIKSSYKRLALKTHPDKNLNDPLANAKFQQVTEAFQMVMGRVSGESAQKGGPFGGFRYEGDSSAGSEEGEEYDDEDIQDTFYEEQLARELFNFIFSNKGGPFVFRFMKQGPCQCAKCVQLRRELQEREQYRAAQAATSQKAPKVATPVRPPNFDPHEHWLSDDEDDGTRKGARSGANKSKKQSKKKKGKQKGKKSSSAKKKAAQEQQAQKASDGSSSDGSDSDDQSDGESERDAGIRRESPAPAAAKAGESKPVPPDKRSTAPAKPTAGQQQAAIVKSPPMSPIGQPSAGSTPTPVRTPSVYTQSTTPASNKSASSFYTSSSAKTTPSATTTNSGGSGGSATTTPSRATTASAYTTPSTPSTLRSTPSTGRTSASAGTASAGSARSESSASSTSRGGAYEHTAALSSGQGSPRSSPDRGKYTGAHSSSVNISTTMPKLEGVQLCRTFLTKHGNCKYGDSCRFSHGGAPGTVAAGQTPLQEASIPGAPPSPVHTPKKGKQCTPKATPKKGLSGQKNATTAAGSATPVSSPTAQRKAQQATTKPVASAVKAVPAVSKEDLQSKVGAEQVPTRVCTFYGTEKGCRYGDKCRFEHKDA